jgi:hypothetical protein
MSLILKKNNAGNEPSSPNEAKTNPSSSTASVVELPSEATEEPALDS